MDLSIKSIKYKGTYMLVYLSAYQKKKKIQILFNL